MKPAVFRPAARSRRICGHRQPDQRLDAGQEDMAGVLCIFLIETDRTLVDSHFQPS